MVGKKPWLAYYGDVPETLDYPEVTIYEALMRSVAQYPAAEAWEFLGTRCSYADFARQVDRCAAALHRLGLSRGDRITIAMPTSPQGITCLYAANRLGAVASMIHPLSAPEEVVLYLNLSRSRIALTLDAFYGKFAEIADQTSLQRLILTRIPDYLGPLKALGFRLTVGRKIPPVPTDPRVVWWKPLLARQIGDLPPPTGGFSDAAVILYSGGTTGTPKGVLLSNRNIICEGMQVSAWGELSPGDSILAILPIFHGFGLGVCVNAAFMGGAKSILVPKFTPADVARLIKKHRPSFLIGVPTLFDALSRSPVFQSADLSCLKAAFCGADQLPRAVKERFEAAVRKRGGDIRLREGYGLTEAVTAIAAMPMTEYREGSIGIPFPDMSAKIVRIATTEEAPVGEEGEICFHGPAVMMGYLDQPEETARTLRVHDDGKTWLHTGD
ncbi:MAG: AMP-binding protein, partial [Desulfobacterales bacterium]